MKPHHPVTGLLISLLTPFVINLHLDAQSIPKANLEITFKGIRNEKGQIVIGMNNSTRGWPTLPVRDYHWKKEKVMNGELTVTIGDLPTGVWAVSTLDDENSNFEMDMFLGIPREGWGFSGNPPLRMSAPGFGECSFLVDNPVTSISIDLRYAGKGR